MQTMTKIPLGIAEISNLMGMEKEEVRAWPYFQVVRELFRDYNHNAINKTDLVSKLREISLKCANEKIYHYSTGVESAISTIQLMY